LKGISPLDPTEDSETATRRVWLLLQCALHLRRNERIFLVYTQNGWQLDQGTFTDE